MMVFTALQLYCELLCPFICNAEARREGGGSGGDGCARTPPHAAEVHVLVYQQSQRDTREALFTGPYAHPLEEVVDVFAQTPYAWVALTRDWWNQTNF